jgi:hypothetical protein
MKFALAELVLVCSDPLADAEDVNADTATSPPEDKALAAVGAALKAVKPCVVVATAVTAEAVVDEAALAPNTLIVQLVLDAAHWTRWATAYSPALMEDAAKVNGWIWKLCQPCWRVLAVPEVVVPEAQDAEREAVSTLDNEVLLPKEKSSNVWLREPAPELEDGKLIPNARSTSLKDITAGT